MLDILSGIFDDVEEIADKLISAVYKENRCIYYFRPRCYQVYLDRNVSEIYLDYQTSTNLDMDTEAEFMINYDGIHLHVIIHENSIIYCDEYELDYSICYKLVEKVASEILGNNGGIYIIYSSPSTNVKYKTDIEKVYIMDGKLASAFIETDSISIASRYKYEDLSQIMTNPTCTSICKRSNSRNNILLCMKATFGLARFIYDTYTYEIRLKSFYNDAIYSNRSRSSYVNERKTFNSLLPSAYDEHYNVVFMNMNGDTIEKSLEEITGESSYHKAINILWKNPALLNIGDNYYPTVRARSMCVLEYSDVKDDLQEACENVISTFKSLVISYMYVSAARGKDIKKISKVMINDRLKLRTVNESLHRRIRNRSDAVATFFAINEDPNTFY